MIWYEIDMIWYETDMIRYKTDMIWVPASVGQIWYDMKQTWYESRQAWDGKEKEIIYERGSQIGVLCYIMPMPGGRLHWNNDMNTFTWLL